VPAAAAASISTASQSSASVNDDFVQLTDKRLELFNLQQLVGDDRYEPLSLCSSQNGFVVVTLFLSAELSTLGRIVQAVSPHL
jgi:hypothetical protein